MSLCLCPLSFGSCISCCLCVIQDYAERRALRSELRSLSKEEKQRQQKAVEEVLKHSSVVCATLTGVATFHLRDLTFDVAVVDEAAQVSSSDVGASLWLSISTAVCE